jgi:hypothetical protein
MSVELKIAEIFVDCETIHLWGKLPQRRRLRDFLRNTTNENTRNSIYRRLLVELAGDRASTIELISTMSTFVPPAATAKKAPPMAEIADESLAQAQGRSDAMDESSEADVETPAPPTPPPIPSPVKGTKQDPYYALSVQDEGFDYFREKADKYFESEIEKCFGRYVSLVAPCCDEAELKKLVATCPKAPYGFRHVTESKSSIKLIYSVCNGKQDQYSST